MSHLIVKVLVSGYYVLMIATQQLAQIFDANPDLIRTAQGIIESTSDSKDQEQRLEIWVRQLRNTDDGASSRIQAISNIPDFDTINWHEMRTHLNRTS